MNSSVKVKFKVNPNLPLVSSHPAYLPSAAPAATLSVQAKTLPINMQATFNEAAEPTQQHEEKIESAPNVFRSFIEQEKKLWHPVTLISSLVFGLGLMHFNKNILPDLLFPDFALLRRLNSLGPSGARKALRKMPKPVVKAFGTLFSLYARLVIPITRPLRGMFKIPPMLDGKIF